MKELVIVSGKGGTGKTSISAALAYLAPNKVLADCDVDAANFHLISGDYQVQENYPFFSGYAPDIDETRCTQCGICTELCRYNAIIDGKITSSLDCEGCGVCANHCPQHAIAMRQTQAGDVFISNTRLGTLVHADLGIAVENSGKLVSKVRQQAKTIAQNHSAPLIITDGPPGIGCPAIAALTGADLALLVTEPSVSGIHDLQRVCQLVSHFHIPLAVCINKYTISTCNSEEIESWCQENSIIFAGKIPYSSSFQHAILAGKNVMELTDITVHQHIQDIWHQVHSLLELS